MFGFPLLILFILGIGTSFLNWNFWLWLLFITIGWTLWSLIYWRLFDKEIIKHMNENSNETT